MAAPASSQASPAVDSAPAIGAANATPSQPIARYSGKAGGAPRAHQSSRLMPTKASSQIATPAATVFPLALTPFEYYYYSDDCAEYPTTFPVELRFSGTLVREHFAAALEETVRRHPLLRVNVEGDTQVTMEALRDETLRVIGV